MEGAGILIGDTDLVLGIMRWVNRDCLSDIISWIACECEALSDTVTQRRRQSRSYSENVGHEDECSNYVAYSSHVSDESLRLLK
ncbi:hypothetical protein Tco_1166928 [Tanacetum coccineum]|uniref:Uncharacterized protein n=1 Tax=Tanacetum coccineum TaxID=301880 RepID=A0ABQ4Z129_9ASTR